ncbi:MAG: hypothetical protein ACRDNP_02260 [Gaiellaceae bacterium]
MAAPGSVRALIFGLVGALALLSAGSAFGAYNPFLLVGETNPALGGTGSVRIFVQVRDQDDATGMVTIYAPRGYGVKLDHPPGTELGNVIAFIRVGPISTPRQAVQGTVRADDPARHALNSCAPGAHGAVWVMELTLAGAAYRLPIYVDRVAAGAEAAYASVRMRACFASPYVPVPHGVSLTYADLTLEKVFTNPDQLGMYPWNGVFVPYAPGTATLNTALVAQSTAYIGLPGTFVVTAKRKRRGKVAFAAVTACLREAGQGVRGITVSIYYGGANVFSSKKVATPRTNASGCATTRIRIRKSMVLFASARVPVRGALGCTPSLAPSCSGASIYPPSGRFRPVRITR